MEEDILEQSVEDRPPAQESFTRTNQKLRHDRKMMAVPGKPVASAVK